MGTSNDSMRVVVKPELIGHVAWCSRCAAVCELEGGRSEQAAGFRAGFMNAEKVSQN